MDHRFPVRPFMPAPFIPHMPMTMRHEGKLPHIFSYDFEDPKLEKKWRNQKEDITDYFNYGMNEEVWRIYAEKVRKLSSKTEKFTNETRECMVLDDTLPLEFGGFGNPYHESLRNIPFLNAVKKNKERFFLKYFFENGDQLKHLFQEALTKEEVFEETEKVLKSTYDAVEPGLLQLKRTLPPENLYAHSRPALPNPSMMQRNIIQNKDIMGIGRPMENRNNPIVNLLQSNSLGFSAAQQILNSLVNPDLIKNEKKPSRQNSPSRHHRSNRRPKSDRSSESVSKLRKDRKEKRESPRREKKRRDKSTSSTRSLSKKKRTDKRKEKDRSRARSRSRDKDNGDEERESRKKSKKEVKERKQESKRRSKEKPKLQRESSVMKSQSEENRSSAKRRDGAIVIKSKNSLDIRNRIQPRKE